jgi:hypothetical protein
MWVAAILRELVEESPSSANGRLRFAEYEDAYFARGPPDVDLGRGPQFEFLPTLHNRERLLIRRQCSVERVVAVPVTHTRRRNATFTGSNEAQERGKSSPPAQVIG